MKMMLDAEVDYRLTKGCPGEFWLIFGNTISVLMTPVEARALANDLEQWAETVEGDARHG